MKYSRVEIGSGRSLAQVGSRGFGAHRKAPDGYATLFAFARTGRRPPVECGLHVVLVMGKRIAEGKMSQENVENPNVDTLGRTHTKRLTKKEKLTN